MIYYKLSWLLVSVFVSWLPPLKFRIFGIIFSCALFLSLISPLSLCILTFLTLGTYYLNLHVENKNITIPIIGGSVCLILLWHKWEGIDQFLLPFGLSYYVLRTIHYSIEAPKHIHSLKEYLCYQFFLPTLFVGPIHRFPEFLNDLSKRKWDSNLCSQGIERILWGYVKIKIIVNFLIGVQFVNWMQTFYETSPSFYQYLDCIRYGSSLYLNFSGYSDIAIGFSLIMGFQILENFHFPFLATSIKEFWNRWHISLTKWSRDYINRPILAYSRNFSLGLILGMILIGLWHEFSWRYIIWGIYHSTGLIIYHQWHAFRKKNIFIDQLFSLRFFKFLSVLLTMNFVIFSFPLTKEPDIKNALKVYQTILYNKYIG